MRFVRPSKLVERVQSTTGDLSAALIQRERTKRAVVKFAVADNVFHELYQDNLRIDGRVATAPIRGTRRWLVVGLAGIVAVLAVAAGRVLLQPGAGHSADAESSAPVSSMAPGPELGDAPVPLAELFGLGVKTIVIDPGHGGRDPGAVGPTNLYEKTVTIDVARRLRRILEHAGFQVKMTRDDDERVSLKDRVAIAIEAEADLFISLHVNALPQPLSMVETFYFGFGGGGEALSLAARENLDSGYSRFEWQEMLSSLGSTMKREESERLAQAIQNKVFDAVRKVNSEARDWGIKPGPFVILSGVPVPAALAEISVISTRKDESLLRQDEYLNNIAEALGSGILTYLGRW